MNALKLCSKCGIRQKMRSHASYCGTCKNESESLESKKRAQLAAREKRKNDADYKAYQKAYYRKGKALKMINDSKNLNELLDNLKKLNEEDAKNIDFSSLPIFTDKIIEDTEGILSYDNESVLVGEGLKDLRIVLKSEWFID